MTKKPSILSADQPNTIFLYSPIASDSYYGDSISSKDVIAAIESLGTVKEINVRINSPGGEVFEGDAIYNALMRSSAKINVFIDGIAASAAGFVAMAGDSIEIAENAFFMMHEAWSIAFGNKRDMAKTITLLDKVDGVQIQIFTAKTGMTSDQVKAWLEAETWFTAQEALDAKLVDRIGTTFKRAGADASAKIAVARYAKAPAALKALAEVADPETPKPATPRLAALTARLRK
jgi:ATP-dependent protease ClpP protease subunit